MATIREIAQRAQVSTATVSHVINSTAYVGPELRRRVQSAVRDLGYQPSAVARSLRTKQSKTVGIVIPDITNPFFADVVRGAEDVLLLEGYTLLIGNSDGDTQKEEQYYRTFGSKQVDGLLMVVAPSDAFPQYLRNHNHDAVPIVYLDRLYRGLRGDGVMADNVGGSFDAVCHLLDLGHRRVAIITGPPQLPNSRLRLEGYKRALSQRGLPIDEELIREGQFDVTSGYEQTKALMELSNRPTGLFVSNALMTIGSLQALGEGHIRCPENMALVSFDDVFWLSLLHPPITAVSHPAYALGAKAAEILLKRLSGQLTGSPVRKVLDTKLIVRESSRPPLGAAEESKVCIDASS